MIRVEVSFRGLVVIILTVLAAWTFIELWPVILLVAVALILMVGLLPFVEALVRRGLPRTAAVLCVMVAILAVLAGLFALMVPAMIRELRDVRDNLPESAREVEELLASVGIRVDLQERARNVDWGGLISGRAAVDYGQRVLTTTFSLITIIVLTAYLLVDMPRLSRFAGQFIPDDRKEEAHRLFFSISRVVGGYLRGQLLTSVCIALFTFVLLRVAGVPNALAFAVLAAFADIIPIIGAFIAIIPPVAAALQESSTLALVVLGGLLAYQQFEDRILVPYAYGRNLNLPPIIVLIAVLAGAELLGIVGVLLALPLAAAGRVVLDYVIENRRLPIVSQATDETLAPDPSDAKKQRLRRAFRRRTREKRISAARQSASQEG